MSMIVTKPAAKEDAKLAKSAEEVALMLTEQINYQELVISDDHGTPLHVYPNQTQIYTLVENPGMYV